jgi:MFS family permease
MFFWQFNRDDDWIFWFLYLRQCSCFGIVFQVQMLWLLLIIYLLHCILSRPLGSAFFGHYGDKIGRNFTLVAALLTMGISTVTIGFCPVMQVLVLAPLLLMLCRFGQGIGLGGEWGGACVSSENAPQIKSLVRYVSTIRSSNWFVAIRRNF